MFSGCGDGREYSQSGTGVAHIELIVNYVEISAGTGNPPAILSAYNFCAEPFGGPLGLLSIALMGLLVRGLGLLLLGLASTAGQLIGSMLIDWLVPALGTQVYLVTVLGAFVALAGAVIAAIPSAKNESDAAASQSIA